MPKRDVYSPPLIPFWKIICASYTKLPKELKIGGEILVGP